MVTKEAMMKGSAGFAFKTALLASWSFAAMTAVAYKGPASAWGGPNDPMVGGRIGGVNVFGGGLGLYNPDKKAVGGVGVSGDTACADHNIAWRVRHELALDNLSGVGGVSGDAT